MGYELLPGGIRRGFLGERKRGARRRFVRGGLRGCILRWRAVVGHFCRGGLIRGPLLALGRELGGRVLDKENDAAVGSAMLVRIINDQRVVLSVSDRAHMPP